MRWAGKLVMVGLAWAWAFSGPAYAQGPGIISEKSARSLQELIGDALQKNPGVKAKKMEYEALRSKVIGSWLPEDPQVGVDVEGQPALFRFNQRMDNEYMVMQTIPFPTKLFLKGLEASREAEIAYQRYKEEERRVVWHVEQPYYELYLSERTLGAVEESRELSELASKTAKAVYEAGKGSQADILKAGIELSKNSIEIFNLKEKIHLQYAHFAHLMNESLETPYEIKKTEARTPLSLSRPDLEKILLRKMPELRAFEIAVERAKVTRSLVNSQWLPDITLRYEGRQFRGDSAIRENDTFIGFSVPVWSLLKGIGGVWKSSDLDVKAAESAYLEMKNEELLKLHEAYSKVKAAENAMTIYENSILPQAKQQAEVALSSYEAGKADFLTLLDANRTLRDSQIEYYKASAEYEMGLSDLRLAVGDDLGRAAHEIK